MTRTTRMLAAGFAVVAMGVATVSAQAATYYVRDGGTGTDCTQATPCDTVEEALAAHRIAPDPADVIDIGAGTFAGFDASDPADQGLTIQGTLAGSTRSTTIRAVGTGVFGFAAIVGGCPDVAVALKDVNVDTVGSEVSTAALSLDGGSSLDNVHAETQPGSLAGLTVIVCSGNSTISDSEIVGTDDDIGVGLFEGLTLRDSTIVTDNAETVSQPPFPGVGPLNIVRSTLHVNTPTGVGAISGGDVTVDSSLITGGFAALVATGTGPKVRIRNATLDSGDPGRDSLLSDVVFENDVGPPNADVYIDSSILVNGLIPSNGTGKITCVYTDLPQPDPFPGWNINCPVGSNGNTTTDPADLFVGGSPFSWVLKPGSPGIDAGQPGGLSNQSTTDLTGAPRRQLGDAANCPNTLIKDKGAYEFPTVDCVPASKSPPFIERGTSPVEGQKLGSFRGNWYGAPTSFAHQWMRCDSDGVSNCTDIAGATRSIYKPDVDDIGHTLRIRVTASNALGDGTATSAPSGVVAGTGPSVRTPPSIKQAANPKFGFELKVYRGQWTDAPTFTFQWVRCDADGVSNCDDITGAIRSSYVPQLEDIGHTLRIRVIATNSRGSSDATSDPSGVVESTPPTVREPPSIKRSADPVTGVELTLYRGTWTGTPTFALQWIRCDADGTSNCTDIAGRTTSSYTPAYSDAGHTLRVRVTATQFGSTDATSAPTGVLTADAPFARGTPKIIDGSSPSVGVPLKSDKGQWTNTPATFTYQWERCAADGGSCADIPSANAATYTPSGADAGHTLRVRVKATNPSGSRESRSPATGVV